MDSLFDPWVDAAFPVHDVLDEVAEISAENPPSEESVQGFLDHRRHLVQEYDITGETPRFLSLVPPPSGIGVGVQYRQSIVGFTTTATIYWWIVAPEYLGGPSRSLVYLTASNQAIKGCEALVEYIDQRPAMFRIWDWSTPPQPDGSRFVVNIPFAVWGGRYLPVTIDGGNYHALYVANRTHKRASPDQWANDVLLFNGATNGWDHVRHREFQWTLDPLLFFRWGPIIEPFKPYNFGTTNPVGYAKARLVTDRVDAILKPNNSLTIKRPIGFEPFAGTPNHTLLAM